ncbi:hypothetical protein [Sphingobacterium faecale]|uniref:Uncharacterized protein n=1 Tax=Sphingobacterium faecale TaxID=2803775 RepID=A0ABS1R941_9SPHI|nr:hypothetical protein [Sphingobacterium faecale]MBL1411230.1 hypothetical protein [Sphingobacterium faecale]
MTCVSLFCISNNRGMLIYFLHFTGALVRNKIDGRRVKHRQGKQAQRRIYYCKVCKGYHLTKWTKQNFNNYTRYRDEERF